MNDETLLHILNHDPQRGMTLLVEQYTGLIWKVISLHLKNPENIKECTNDTFVEFYFHRDRFNPERSSLSVWLTAIARNLAISCFRKERKSQAEPLPSVLPDTLLSDHTDEIALAEIQVDLERAMAALNPDELQIIRMRYYDGMTVREIADSLELPYETLKKRHQRSIVKLRRALFLTILILLALLTTACSTYVVLRHFDIIPPIFSWEKPETEEEPEETPQGDTEKDNDTGYFSEQRPEDSVTEHNTEAYTDASADTEAEDISDTAESDGLDISAFALTKYGVNETADKAVYELKAPVSAENDHVFISLDQASYLNETLTLIFTIILKEESISTSAYIICGEQNSDYISSSKDVETKRTGDSPLLRKEVTFPDFDLPAPENEENEVNLSLLLTTHTFSNTDSYINLDFTLCSTPQEPIDSYTVQTYENGGLLAVPRLEDGSLIIAIHPLNGGDYTIQPSLIRGIIGELEDGSVTVTDADGNEITGNCLRYYPSSSSTYFEWDFGAVSPGEYTLHVPYLYVTAPFPDDIHFSIQLTGPSGLTWEDTVYTIPGGTLWIEDIEPLDASSEKVQKLFPADETYYLNCHFWSVNFGYHSENDMFTILKPYTMLRCQAILVDGIEGERDASGAWISFNVTGYDHDMGTGIQELLIRNQDESFNDITSVTCTLIPSPHYRYTLLRWNQSFDLTFTVKAED